MEHIKAIQTLVDEHKEHMPTGAVTAIMAELQKAYDGKPELCKAECTFIYMHAYVVDDGRAHAEVHKITRKQTMFIEMLEERPEGVNSDWQMLRSGRGLNRWLTQPHLPLLQEVDGICVIRSLTLLTPEPSKERSR